MEDISLSKIGIRKCNKLLDDLLRILESTTSDKPIEENDLYDEIKKRYNLSKRDKRILIDKLCTDEYAKHIPINRDNIPMDGLFITYKGVLFILKNGYTNQHYWDKLKELAKWANIVVAIIVGIIVILTTIFKNDCHHTTPTQIHPPVTINKSITISQ